MYANIPFILKGLHLIPIVPVYLVIFTVTSAFTKFYLLDHNPFTILKIINSLLFYFSATMVIINHGLCMLVSPGFVRFGWQPPVNINTRTQNPESSSASNAVISVQKELTIARYAKNVC
jgi:hypothetical protein